MPVAVAFKPEAYTHLFGFAKVPEKTRHEGQRPGHKLAQGRASLRASPWVQSQKRPSPEGASQMQTNKACCDAHFGADA